MLAIDLPEAHRAEIRAGGFNLHRGSFGTPVKVRRSDRYAHVLDGSSLPNVTEQEVVIADLAGPAAEDVGLGEEPVAKAIWQQMSRGVIDPRPLAMFFARKHFDRIYRHGGIFILFAAPRQNPNYVFADPGEIAYGTELAADNWSLLGELANLQVGVDHGTEIKPAESSAPAFAPIAAALKEATFTCTVEPTQQEAQGRWATLARSKYGDPVAGVLGPEPDSGNGYVIVLPRIARKGELMRALLEDLLPKVAPKLFPEDERRAWIEDDAYAAPGISALQAEIEQVQIQASSRVEEIRAQIATLRGEGAHLRALLTESGTLLVDAVQKTLAGMGIAARDVDAEEGQSEGRLYEDLRLDGGSPVALAEVKGINGLPSDEEALEIQKCVLKRIRELDRTDIRGLTIVNHQRSLPPSERDPRPFEEEQVKNARDQDVGLITTLDLYRLARGFQANGWRAEDIEPLLRSVAGRIDPVPAHYERIGKVVNFYEKAGALTVQLDESVELAVGERVGFGLELDYAEQDVCGLQIDGEDVERAPGGSHIGLKTQLTKAEGRHGTPVYRVKR